jgi:hypothetical protein
MTEVWEVVRSSWLNTPMPREGAISTRASWLVGSTLSNTSDCKRALGRNLLNPNTANRSTGFCHKKLTLAIARVGQCKPEEWGNIIGRGYAISTIMYLDEAILEPT